MFVYHNEGGVRRTLHVESEDRFTVKTDVVVDQIIDTNSALRENLDPRSTNKLVARVPLTIYEKSIIEKWDDADWKKFLNDPDNKVFRVWEGRV